MVDQLLVIGIILLALLLFVWSKWRYDIVALIALMLSILVGIITPENAFVGFSHPAIITVAAVLVVSRSLINVGAMDPFTKLVNQLNGGIHRKIMLLMGITAFFSCFMNNVGAPALTMPIALKVSKDNHYPVSSLLMPIAFASLLGGLVSEIGTPPNLIISMYRKDISGVSFGLFDFAPVGIILTVIGILFISVYGYKLIPHRKSKTDTSMMFQVENYLSELVITENSKVIGLSVREFSALHQLDVNILSIIRNHVHIISPQGSDLIIVGDLLCVRIEPADLALLLEKTGVQLKGAKLTSDESGKVLSASDHSLIEIVLRDDSPLIGHTAITSNLRNVYNVNLVAISRQGVRLRQRIAQIYFRTGDILLLHVANQNINTVVSSLRGLPLAERGIALNTAKAKMSRTISLLIFWGSIILTAFNFLPVQVSFLLAALLMILTKTISVKEVYESIEWPVIIMLGAMLQLGDALQSTGAADTMAAYLIQFKSILSPEIMVGILLLCTLILTNFINNAAAAVIMAPIGVSLAQGLGVSIDPMLMAVAIGASSAFMTPIGHQSNTLIMGPGGYHFKDYWHMGLPLSVLVLLIGTPMILLFWPL